MLVGQRCNRTGEMPMARVQIELPETWEFITELPVRITDVNYGGHVGNDAMLALLHEARMRWLASRGWTEQNVDGVGLIMLDATLVFRTEAFYGDTLEIGVTVAEMARTGFVLAYRASMGDREVCRARTGMAFFDYQRRRVVGRPEAFAQSAES